MEWRMRRGNIGITGMAEKPGSSITTAMSKLLIELLQMDRSLTGPITPQPPTKKTRRTTMSHHRKNALLPGLYGYFKTRWEQAPLSAGWRASGYLPRLHDQSRKGQGSFQQREKSVS